MSKKQTYYINLDIKDSTILWRCSEKRMVNTFLFEWSIVTQWSEYYSKRVKVTGQFGDEWKMTFTGTKAELQNAIRSLSIALNTLKDVARYKVPREDSEKQTVNCTKYSEKIDSRKSLFRIGVSTKSPQVAEVKEQKCVTDKVCSNSKMITYTANDKENDTFVKTLKTKDIQKITRSAFKKINTFYVFTYQDPGALKNTGMTMIKSKKKNKKLIVSYKTQNIDIFTTFVHTCIKKGILYSSAYGPVYVPKRNINSKKLKFIRKDDVYGDIVNTAAKVLGKMIQN